jgi:hypothetical protein
MLAGMPELSMEELIAYLVEVLPDVWCAAYQDVTPTDTNILQFQDEGFEFLFDCSSALLPDSAEPERLVAEDRVVAVFGRSRKRTAKRDASRMQGFLGPTSKVFGKQFDKGHFMGHALGGGLDVNLFPQRRAINRGWSAAGKVFRDMERYCARNPGTFCFSRPIYHDLSWYPVKIEYGLLKKDGTFRVEQFEN